MDTHEIIDYQPLISESPYPVFWVEAFNEAKQNWIAVDPLVTKTINKPHLLEPPISDRYNNMVYVLAFEDDSSVRDVSRRYTKSFNAKTYKNRVETTPHGEEWWKQVMKIFTRPVIEDRDQVEMAEFTARAAAEPMPRSVQDFKDHPIYSLERRLRRNEVIYPKRPIGKVPVGKQFAGKANPVVDNVYRRSDVHIVRSADGWFRLGRQVKLGEQPLKRVKLIRNNKPRGSDFEFEGGEPDREVPLYAEFQTELYVPPPINSDTSVPRNAFGNVDLYVPSMVPRGGFHIRHPEASRAARILGIDYANAVTGFHFRGRHGTAITDGIVASVEFKEALIAVLQGLENEKHLAEREERIARVLAMWKTLLTKLKIAERVQGYASEDEKQEDENQHMNEWREKNDYQGGGFMPEDGGMDGDGSIPEDEGEDGGFFRADETGGGFILDEEASGGFIRDEDELACGFEPATSPNSGGFTRVGDISDSFQRENIEGDIMKEAVFSDGNSPQRQEGKAFKYSYEEGNDLFGNPDVGGGFVPSSSEAPVPTKLSTKHLPRIGPRKASAPLYELVVIPNSRKPESESPLPKWSSKKEQNQNTISELTASENENSEKKHEIQNASVEGKQREEPIAAASALYPRQQDSSDDSIFDNNSSKLSHDPEDDDAEPEWLL